MQESLGHLKHLQEATSCHRNRADKSEKLGQMWSLNEVQRFLGNAILLLEEIIGLRKSQSWLHPISSRGTRTNH